MPPLSPRKAVLVEPPDNPSTRYTPERLLKWGQERAEAFIKANGLPPMQVFPTDKKDWVVGPCAYWRDSSCFICVEHCARPASGENDRRNWNWPGSVTDRTPYGVICHELGHHTDFHSSPQKDRGTYWGNASKEVFKASGEKAITSYEADDPHEWYAEMMRLFITNHALLYAIRPKTWDILCDMWKPVSDNDWETALGPDCPQRVLSIQEKR